MTEISSREENLIARENFIEKREETGEGEAGGSGGMQADAKMWTAASSREPALLSSSFRRLVGYLWLDRKSVV